MLIWGVVFLREARDEGATYQKNYEIYSRHVAATCTSGVQALTNGRSYFEVGRDLTVKIVSGSSCDLQIAQWIGGLDNRGVLLSRVQILQLTVSTVAETQRETLRSDWDGAISDVDGVDEDAPDTPHMASRVARTSQRRPRMGGTMGGFRP